MHKFSYGLFVLTVGGDQPNGMITNSVIQVASEPTRISVAVQKGNLTRELIEQTGAFNVSVLTEDVPFEVIRHFGMQSGRDTDKLAQYKDTAVSASGIPYLTKYANAFFSAKVLSATDLGSHVLFIAEVTESEVLSNAPSCTYAHYHAKIKPKL